MFSKASFFVRSISQVAIANFITKPLWLLLFIYAARALGPYQFGIYTFSFSIVVILSIIIDFGFDYITIREISVKKDLLNQYVSNILFYRVTVCASLICLISLYNHFFATFDTTTLTVVILLLFFQSTVLLLQFFRSAVSALQYFKIFSQMLIFEKLILIFLGTVSLIISPNLKLFIAALLCGNVITTIVFLFVLKRKLQFIFNLPSLQAIKYLIKSSLPLLIMNIFIMAYFRIDVIFLNWFVSDKSIVGIYGSIHRIIEMYFLIPTIIMSTAYPIITKSLSENKEYVISLINKILKLISLVTLPIVFVISFNSYEFNLLLFGEKYKIGYSGLTYIVWTILPLGFNYLLGHVLIAINKQKYCAISLIVASAVNIVLNIVLIPYLSFVGTSISLFVTEFVIFLFYSYFVNKYLGSLKLFDLIIKVFVIIFLVFIFHFVTESLYKPNTVVNAIGLLIITAVLFKIFNLFDFASLKNLLNQRKAV